MTTALIYDPIFLEHITPLAHPEKLQRLEVAMEVLEALNWLQREGRSSRHQRFAPLCERGKAGPAGPAFVLGNDQ